MVRSVATAAAFSLLAAAARPAAAEELLEMLSARSDRERALTEDSGVEDPRPDVEAGAAAAAPPNMTGLECMLHQLAFEFGVSKAGSSAARALHDALLLPNCTMSLPRDAIRRSDELLSGARAFPAPAAAAARRRAAAAGAELWVSPAGSDAAPGTKAAPLATLAKAQELMRAKRGGGAGTVWLLGGKYHLTAPLLLDARDSHTAWRAAPGERPVLSGALSLQGAKWTTYKGEIMSASVQLPPRPSPAPEPTALPTPAPPPPPPTPAPPGCDDCGCEFDTDFAGNDVKQASAHSTGECCALCRNYTGCSAFTWRDDGGNGPCWLKSSDAGRRPGPTDAPHISGRPGHPSGKTPAPPAPGPPPAPPVVKPPAFVNQLFHAGERQVRARFPNGNPHHGDGICFSATNRPGEGCSSYVKAAGGAGTQPAGTSVKGVSFPLNRGDSPTRGCGSQCHDYGSFKYTVYEPPPGHPVYTDPLPGMGWGNNSLFSFWGSPFSRPAGVKVDKNSWTKNTWAEPSTAAVHMFHSGLWGGWQYQVSGFDGSTLTFAYGGFQEARGSGINSQHYYVDGIMEELDVPGEWFFDEKASKVYFWPNSSAPLGDVALPVLNELVRVEGAPGAPATDVTLDGLEFTETRSTFFEPYEVPSGGDWSVYRGGAVVVQDAERVTVSGCVFNQTGGNGLLLSNHVTGSAVSGNEFVYTGDSAVVSLGSTNGVDGTAPTFPDGNTIEGNHMHEVGVYGKQTSCFFQALSARTVLKDNVCYNGPRAGVNFNDGFFGAYHMEGNLVFNMVRETGDHGPFNSWDRQPYLTLNGVDDGYPADKKMGMASASIVSAESVLTRNFIINGYNGVWTIDHDDGSQQYNDTGNLMVWGGCKNYRGNSKTCDSNVILFPGIGERSAGGRKCQTDDNGIFANQFFTRNRCVTDDGNFYSFGGCKNPNTTAYHTSGNKLYSPGKKFSTPCGIKSWEDWQNEGQDAGSALEDAPSFDEIIAMAKDVLHFSP